MLSIGITHDYAETAAAIANLDLLVTVDTAVLLGKSVTPSLLRQRRAGFSSGNADRAGDRDVADTVESRPGRRLS